MISSSNSEGFREQFFNRIGGLLERHIAIVVAVDEQDGGPPVRDNMSF
jgi:hypothetical protein